MYDISVTVRSLCRDKEATDQWRIEWIETGSADISKVCILFVITALLVVYNSLTQQIHQLLSEKTPG